MEELQRLKDLAVSESGFVFDPYTGSTFSVNETGLTFLRGLKEGLGRDEIVERVEEAFEIVDDDIERDLVEFIQLLRESGLVPLTFTLE
jgi:hypothetical protein